MPNWNPSYVKSHVETYASSTRCARVVTDAGIGYLKAMGNPEGEHALACDLVGTRLAELFGLPVLDMRVINLDDVVPVPFQNGKFAKPGPAIVTRHERGSPWQSTLRELDKLENKEDLTKLVIFDTWILNRDRHFPPRVNRDNVFLSHESKKRGNLRLLAIDHTHSFGCRGEIRENVSQIANVKDDGTYGLFPEFRQFLSRSTAESAVEFLSNLEASAVQALIAEIPAEWDVSMNCRNALLQLIVSRASFLTTRICDTLWPQKSLPFKGHSGELP